MSSFNKPPKNFTNHFSKVIASGVDEESFQIISLGSDQSVSQSSGNLVLTSGTTANSETIIRSNIAWTKDFIARVAIILSQRIVDNNFIYEFVDVIGDDLDFTINSTTSVTVTLPENHNFTSQNVGQSISIGAIRPQPLAIPGRYVIASVVGSDMTLTVSGWPSSGTGKCSLFGWNFIRTLYDGTSATSKKIDAGRDGWATGDTTVTGVLTTASLGNVSLLSNVDGNLTWGTQAITSSGTVQSGAAGTRINHVPKDTVNLFLQIRMLNGSTAPASTTTQTIGFASVESFDSHPVNISSVRYQSLNAALPVTFGGVGQPIAGTAAIDAAASGNPVQIGTVVRSALPTTYATGDAAAPVATLAGVLVNAPYTIPEASWQYPAAASGILNTTTAVTIKTAAATGVRNYITSIDVMHQALGTATELAIRDGAGGTVIWRSFLPAGATGRFTVEFPVPLRGTAATLLEVVTLTATGTGAVYFNAQGYAAV
jgi:hypothetical protein